MADPHPDMRWLFDELHTEQIGDREWIARYVDKDGAWCGVIEMHELADGRICGGSVMFAMPYGAPAVPRSEGVQPRWKVEQSDPLTLTPSVLCSPDLGGCGHHGYITQGRWT